MNHMHVSGYLVTDIEEKLINDRSLCKFTLVSRQGERALYLPVEVWNQAHLPKYLHKSSRVLVSGFLKQENWQDKGGEKHSRIVMVGTSVEFLDASQPQRAEKEGGGEAAPQYA